MNYSPRRLGAGLRLAAAAAVSALFLLPLAWMVSASLRQPGLPPPRTIEWLPNPVAWDNYTRLFDLLPMARYTANSLLVAGAAVPITLLAASWAGFAMAQMPPRAQRRLVLVSVGLLLVPVTSIWLARFMLLAWLRLTNSHAALLAPAVMGTSPLFVLLFYWAFRRVPPELYELARLEGAGALATWWRVGLPLARPTLVAVGVLTFLFYWSDFISPLLYLRSQSLYTLPVGLRQLQQLDRSNWPLLMAAAVVVTLPVVLLFLVVQRYFLADDGLAGGPT
jgi:multiple sugar transport system permease protein